MVLLSMVSCFPIDLLTQTAKLVGVTSTSATIETVSAYNKYFKDGQFDFDEYESGHSTEPGYDICDAGGHSGADASSGSADTNNDAGDACPHMPTHAHTRCTKAPTCPHS